MYKDNCLFRSEISDPVWRGLQLFNEQPIMDWIQKNIADLPFLDKIQPAAINPGINTDDVNWRVHQISHLNLYQTHIIFR